MGVGLHVGLRCLVGRFFVSSLLRPVGSITSACLGRQEWLVRCQGSSTTSSGAGSTDLLFRGLRSPGAQTVTDRVRWARPLFVAYCFCSSTFSTSSGASGWIPAGNNGAPQGSQGVRGVRFENDYLFRGWRAGTRRRQRGFSRHRDGICARTACLSTVSATTMASCMEHKVALATGSPPPGQRAVEQSRDQEGLIAVKERKRVFGHVHLSGILGASAGLRGGHAAVFPLLLRKLPCVSFCLRSCCALAQERK